MSRVLTSESRKAILLCNTYAKQPMDRHSASSLLPSNPPTLTTQRPDDAHMLTPKSLRDVSVSVYRRSHS